MKALAWFTVIGLLLTFWMVVLAGAVLVIF